MAASLSWKRLVSFVSSYSRISLTEQAALNGTWRTFSCTSKNRSSDDKVSEGSEATPQRDPLPLFLDETVQELLKRITGFDLMATAGPKKRPLKSPVYKLLTDEQYAQELAESKERLKRRLQMPPYMNPRKPNLEPLSVDPALAEFDTSSYVFTDISFGVKDRHRNVVVRESDGTLKIAPWDVKERMNQIYNPRVGREYLRPRMFEEEHLERMISERRYEFILDRACCQFEPDDPDFIRTTHRVYNAIDKARQYDVLRSTRHFGSMAFYLVWYRMIDFLLLDMINRDLSSDAQDLISLYCIIHPGSSCAEAIKQLDHKEPSNVIKAYIETDAKEKARLELALQAMEDARRAKEEDHATS